MRILPRKRRFDLSNLPLHWVAGDAQTTHTINTLSLLLPAGERFFVDLFKSTLPHVTDEQLRREVRGFIGQEANHAFAHDRVQDILAQQGLDVTAFLADLDWLFQRVLADAPFGRTLPARLQQPWLRCRVALVAAVEHFTTMLGIWVLEAEALARASDHGPMMDLLLWHGAEEVEHRSVAFDVAAHLGSGYLERAVSMVVAITALTYFWVRGVGFMMRQDPSRPGPATWSSFLRAGEQGHLPRPGDIIAAVARYLRPSHHPSVEREPETLTAVLHPRSGAVHRAA